MKRLQLCLAIGPSVSEVARKRITHAFDAFCGVYGYDPLVTSCKADTTDLVRVCYGLSPTRSSDVSLPNVYVPRPANVLARSPQWVALAPAPIYAKLGIKSAPCFFTQDGRPDWLGEIFEWLSCADEHAVVERDEAGRIPYASSVHGRFQLDPCVPYAGIAMYELNRAIRSAVGAWWPNHAQAPTDSVLIAATHDIDFLPTSLWANLQRLIKNAAIAALHFRDPKLAVVILFAALRGLMLGKSPLNYIEEMLTLELNARICSTFNVICRKAHARDANYDLDDEYVRRTLRLIAENGMEIALHGSYMSLKEKSLPAELELLERAGYHAVGLRQHWLRFAGDNLFREIARLGLSYDSTVGFSENIGFRAGACFPYLPYDFEREQPFAFVEIPLVVMDVALYEQAKKTGISAKVLTRRVFDMIESFGWGGVAILWHNTAFGGGQMPAEIGQLYWELKRPSHRWISCRDVALVASQRLQGTSKRC
jgi:hypothetical protein